METEILTPLLNRAGTLPDDGWYHLVSKGDHPLTVKDGEGRSRRVMQRLDDKACADIVTEFVNRRAADPGYRKLVDFEHFSWLADKSSEAAGWIVAMQNRSDGVWFQADWSDIGEAAIKNRRYRTISPVWKPSDCEHLGGNVYRPRLVRDAGLTNKNNLEGLVPFWNREFHGREAQHETDNKGKPMPKERLIAILSLAASATDDQIVEAVQAFKNRASLYDTLKTQHDTLVTDNNALKNRHSTLLTACVDSTLTEFAGIIVPDAKDAWKNRLTADYDGTRALLKGLKPAAAASTDEKRVEDTLKEYQGVITAESRDSWKNRLASDFDGTVTLLKSIKKPDKKEPLHKSGGGKGAAETTAEEQHPFMNRVSEVMTERKLDRADAIAAVASEETALYDDYRESVTSGGE